MAKMSPFVLRAPSHHMRIYYMGTKYEFSASAFVALHETFITFDVQRALHFSQLG